MATHADREKLYFDPSQPCCAQPTQADFFPDILDLKSNVVHRGRIFSAVERSVGVGVQEHHIEVDEQAWLLCLQSPHFEACYRLSLAKLELRKALMHL